MTRLTRIAWLALTAGMLAGATLPPSTATAADPPAAGAAASPFAGKIVYVVLGANNAQPGLTYLVNARVETIAGRPFLVGTTLDTETGRPIAGVSEWLALDTVQRLSLFDDFQTMRVQMSRQ